MANKFILSKGKFLLPKGGWATSSKVTNYSITPTLTNVTADLYNKYNVEKDEIALLKFTANSGYELPSSVSVTGATGTWNKNLGTLLLTDITGDVSFNISGSKSSTSNYLCFTANTAGSTILMELLLKAKSGLNFRYSTNGSSWNEFTPALTVITLQNVGDKVYFIGNNPNGINSYDPGGEGLSGYTFKMTGSVSASGNIMSLVDNGACTQTTVKSNCFIYMFNSNPSLTSAPELPGTNLGSGSYSNMFRGCTSLIYPPDLPATYADSRSSVGAYDGMFYGCTSLKSLPRLMSARLVYNKVYLYMFYGCTSLLVSDTQTVDAPIQVRIPSSGTFTSSTSHSDVFTNCLGTRSSDDMSCTSGGSLTYYTAARQYNISTNLTNVIAGASNPTIISQNDIETLTFSPVNGYSIGSVVVTGATYQWKKSTGELIISNATDNVSITMSAILSAQYNITTTLVNTLADPGNRSVVKSGETTTLRFTPEDGYALPQSIDVTGSSKTWLPSGGILALNNPTSNVSVSIESQVVVPSSNLCFTANTAGSTVALNNLGWSLLIYPDVKYSYDGNNWELFSIDSTVITLLNVGDKVFFKGDNLYGFNQSLSAYCSFVLTGSIAASGNIMSLIDDGACSETAIPNNYCFYMLFGSYSYYGEPHPLTSAPELSATTLTGHCYENMFYGCNLLQTAPSLPAVYLEESCYSNMFSSCSSLTAAPALPATTLSNNCYDQMFYSCTSLTSAPDLPATTLSTSCYSGMFSSCTSLTAAPELSASTLFDNCYNSMFLGCSLLESAPALPATVLASRCYYNMFSSCSSLTTAPTLPTTDLADYCYSNMFYGCTSLTTAPALPATALTDGCYSYMFSCCSLLESAPALPATVLAFGCYSGMFNGCIKLQQAPVLPATTALKLCYNNMFSGCTSLTTAPALPATTLAESCYLSMFLGCTSLANTPLLNAILMAESCYRNMFYGCTSLVNAPVLPATTLSYTCYQGMFYGCSSLTSAPALPATTLFESCYREMFRGCTSLTTAPALQATELASYCYGYMFFGCTSLTHVPQLPSTELTTGCYLSMFYGCTSLYVSSSQTSSALNAWAIPSSGTITSSTKKQSYVFTNCLGTRSSDDIAGARGYSYTYYTQNQPIA